MNRFCVAIAFVSCAYGAPTHTAIGYAGAGLVGAPVAHAPAVVGQTHHSYAAGAPIVENRVEYGVVGQRTVQTGEVAVVAGHQYAVAGVEHIPQPATSYVAGAPQNLVETRPIAPPAIPAPPAPYAAIPPAPVPAGPAPADTVTVQRIAAPVRTHTKITPVQTQIVPQLQVNKYNVDVPVHVPVPVEREVVVAKHVAKPYNVEVPRPVHVAKPYKVHPVQEIVEQPHVHHATYTTHSATPVVTQHVGHAVATAVHAAAPVAAAVHAAPVAAVHAAAPVAAAVHAAP